MINDVVLVLSAVLVVTIVLLDFIGLLDQIRWLNARLPTITLLAISLVLIATVIDRYTRLTRIERLLQQAIDANLLGVQYLEDSSSVTSELEKLAEKAHDFVIALGSKSTASPYLDQIKSKVFSGQIIYYRLLTGDHITHVLHSHLDALIDNSNVHIAWNPSEKYGTLTISEHEVILALPTPHTNRFSGIKFGAKNVLAYNQYFQLAFQSSIPLKSKRAIEVLCESCSPSIAHNELQIENILKDELAVTQASKASGHH